jgi:hypothetical protein
MTPAATDVAPAVLAFLFVPILAGAQRVSSSVDIGGSSMRYADTITSNGPSVSPSVWLNWERSSLAASGTYSHFSGGWSSQGAVSGSVFTPSSGVFVGELGGSAGGSMHADDSRTGETLAMARVHAMGDTRGAWVGAGAGRTWDGFLWRTVLASEVGAWLNEGGLSLVGSLSPMRVDDTIKYVDTQLSSRWSSAKLELGASVGIRGGAHVPAIGGPGNGWGSVAVVAWLAPQVGVVLDAGTYPVDLTQGFPGGRFATLSLRLRTSPSSPRASRSAAAEEAARSKGVASFSVQPGSNGTTLRLRAPGARSVEVMGDFTAWKPVPMRPAGDGSWFLAVPTARGAHQMNIRVDGGAWSVPPGLPVVTDEFGGSFGLLIIQ